MAASGQSSRTRRQPAVTSNQAMLIVTGAYAFAGFGLAFWAVAASVMNAATLGYAATIISVGGLVACLSLLGINRGIVPLLLASQSPSKLTAEAIMLVPLIATMAAFVLMLPHTIFATQDFDEYFPFLLAIATLTALSTILETVFTALRHNRFGIQRALGFSLVKLALLPLLAAYGGIAVCVAFVVGLVAGLAAVLPGLRRGPEKAGSTGEAPSFRSVARFSALTFAFVVGYTSVDRAAPVMILIALGPAFAAYYYLASVAGQVLFYLPGSFARAGVPEGTASSRTFDFLFRRTLARNLVILAPLVVLSPFLGSFLHDVLGGPAYAAHSLLLTFLVASTVPSAIVVFFLAYLNLAGRPRKVFELAVVFAASNVTIFLLLLASTQNLDWLGLAWVLGATLTAGYGYLQYRVSPLPESHQEEPTDDYRAHWWYSRSDVVASYDAQRFHRPIGFLVNRLEKSSLRRALAGLPRPAKTLEIACGSGRMTHLLLQEGYRTLATDVSAPMIAEARRTLPANARSRGYALCDSSYLPFGDDSFDVLVGFRFLAHLPIRVRDQVLSEVARVTKASVVLSAQTPWSLKFLYRYLIRLGDPINPPFALSPRAFGREAERFGLRLVSIHHSLPLIAETYVAVFEKQASA